MELPLRDLGGRGGASLPLEGIMFVITVCLGNLWIVALDFNRWRGKEKIQRFFPCVLRMWEQVHVGWLDRDKGKSHSSRRTGMEWVPDGGHGVCEPTGRSWEPE